MFHIFNKILNNHLRNIGNPDQKNKLLVLIGFPKDILTKIAVEKLLDINLDISLNQLMESKPIILQELILKTTQHTKNTYWCTYEEFLTVGPEILSLYFDYYIFKNNVYHQKFPLIYAVDGIEEIYEGYFKNDEYSPEEFLHPSLNILLNFYGDLEKINEQFYISYATDYESIDFFTAQQLVSFSKQNVYEPSLIELTEEERTFLELIDNILYKKIPQKEICISYNGNIENLPNNYLKRLNVLQYLFPDIKFVLVSKTLDRKTEIQEEKYLEILRKYWGYSSFRNLKMYKNINDNTANKETILIPQSQIIDDIVKQAENARSGSPFRDVFVTSPTGAGKSIMFQIPAIYLAEKYNLMTIVISPLIGLMKDQVYSLLEKKVDISATINSEITPVEKIEIINKIQEGKISILYISPETLLSRSDIKQLIGERQVGLFVIDEAHIVTTWGKAFRSDYWYLGSYLQKLRKEMKFPIATFTATAIYGGIEDMYGETRDSLNMINPISYFGYVKREDLEVRIQKAKFDQGSFNEYLFLKYSVLLNRISNFLEKNQKTLIYFPMIRYIHNFLEFVKSNAPKKVHDQITVYYGTMTKEEKQESFLKFRNGDSLVMLATKAFGMGIDIPDIYNVLHFAPTGNVCDYIQEIGRAARKLDHGRAFFDYFSKDFVHVNRLHGISTIKKHQLIQVIEKIVRILEQNNKERKFARNLLVNAEEFRYIFEKKSRVDQDDDIDNKLKTALLIIEKDFIQKMGYSPIVARPRSIFANEYFMIEHEQEKNVLNDYASYFRLISKRITNPNNIYGNVYVCDMKQLWEDYYSHLSFPQFKYKFHSKSKDLNLPFLKHILPVLQLNLELKAENIHSFLFNVEKHIDQISDLFNTFVYNQHYFKIEDVSKRLQKILHKSSYYCDSLTSIFIQSAENYNRLLKKTKNFHTNFIKYYEERDSYTITSGFFEFTNWIKTETKNLLHDHFAKQQGEKTYEIFIPKTNGIRTEKIFILLGILEALGLLIYKVNGGDSPEIYIRINSKLQLDRIIKDPFNYRNVILENVYNRHKISVAMLTFLFENEVQSNDFWEYIEDYFLGKIPNEVLAKVN
ncbi:DEAD/DEAH box helicase [Parageobacillus toebii NBRC 107807]|uniref:DNA 3'-5' helicase n=1 Tax=Parageobacillus toebii NBRC 107807 TaxID=1223503 RepID=A0A6G9J6R7_9BACL|nr:DEAD/DEAH box helicase [Parageobacillus toebii]MBB3870242.1 ATP-dependent DNA helicase RecQ [Parageobacillus toebii NBRC 107807]QIQ33879.1 DEAD/DEAH box helicase [Parageobacillus toebii NBRC 107807]